MRPLTLLFLIYSLVSCLASGQITDPTTDIANQVDTNVGQALTNGSHAQVVGQGEIPPGTAGEKSLGGSYGEYSGYRNASMKPPTALFTANYFIGQETFNEKNSFLGTGVTNTFLNQVGCDITTPFGTDIQPFFAYQYASRHLLGTTTYRANSYGASLNLSQKIFPFCPLFGKTYADCQPGAVYNLACPTPDQIAAVQNGSNELPNLYPNFDVKLGLSLGATDVNLSNFKGNWSYATQDMYGISPNMAFDFYFRKASLDNKFSLLPNAISIIPTYNDQLTSANNGTSNSSGILSVQDRNTYIWALHSTGDTDGTIDESVQVIESNTILHDTNQEPLPGGTTPVVYQNWAKFGLAVAYVSKSVTGKVEYTYEAFNAQYDSQNVVATINVSF